LANRDNPYKGRRFEDAARNYFNQRGLRLERIFPIDVGVNNIRKPHRFDLGSSRPPILVECKAHTWTAGGNAPSAKLSVWNEAMYYFHAAPSEYRKIFFVLKSVRTGITLAEHYIGRFEHLIPEGVEIWEFDPNTDDAACIYEGKT